MEKLNFTELNEFKALKSVVEQMLKQEGIQAELENLVFKTTDYSHLKRMSGNRNISKVNKLKKNVETNGQKYTLGIVNKNLEISDGQHRKQVFEEMGLPFYFVIKDMTIKDTRAINQSQTNWNRYDFIYSYAEEGNEEYVNYKKFIEQYPSLKSVSKEIIQNSLTQRNMNADGFVISKKIELGNFTCPDWTACYERASYIMMFKDVPEYNKQSFVGAIMRMITNEHLRKDRLVKKVTENADKIKAYRNSFLCEKDLVRMYNSGMGGKVKRLELSKECIKFLSK